jgi:Fe(3+) dicitrate transport protein
MVTAAIGYTHRSGFDMNTEAMLLGEQFADDLNTIEPTADGQRGLVPGYTLWNAAANYPLTRSATIFLTVKNMFDRTVIVDRSRGIMPSMPRLVQFGLKVRF